MHKMYKMNCDRATLKLRKYSHGKLLRILLMTAKGFTYMYMHERIMCVYCEIKNIRYWEQGTQG